MVSIHSEQVHCQSSSSLTLPKQEEKSGSLIDLITVVGTALSLGCGCAQTVGLSQYAVNRWLGNCEVEVLKNFEHCFPTFGYGIASLGFLASVVALRHFAVKSDPKEEAEDNKSALPQFGRLFGGFVKADLTISSAVLAWYSARNALEWTARYFDGCTSSWTNTLESIKLDPAELQSIDWKPFEKFEHVENREIVCNLQVTTITDHCKLESQRAAMNGLGFLMVGTAALTCAFAPTAMRKIAGLFSGVDRQPEAAQQKPEDKKRVA